jgi:myo-inositol-1(or 4)-monophosphatase
MIDLEWLTTQVAGLVRETGIFIADELGRVANDQIETKDKNSLVSYVDKSAEQRLVKGLKPLLPGASFMTEEETDQALKTDSPYTWIIGPLDGTTNFLHQLPCFAISVALAYHNEIQIGVVLEVNRGELFKAWKGGGAYLNNKPIRVSDTSTLEDALIATGFPYIDFSHFDVYLPVFNHLLRHCRGLRRWGAAAVDLVYVACGRFDGFFEGALNAWDVAAGLIIVEEAGGSSCDFKGENTHWFGGKVIAGNKFIMQDLKNLFLAKHLQP